MTEQGAPSVDNQYGSCDIATHMKTTIDIADALLRQAKREAVRRQTTLRALVEEGLRKELGAAPESEPYVLPDLSWGGGGLVAGLEWGDWPAMRAIIYEGRGE